MEKIKNLVKKINNQHLIIAMTVIVLIQPLIDLDYLIYPWLNPTGLPLPSTLIYFIGMPLVFFMAFLLKESNKKKVFWFVFSYLAIVGVYFIAHHIVVKDMFELLYLTNRYKYSITTELRYVLTLIIPLGLVYAFFKTEFDSKVFDRIILWSSILISFPLFFSNLFTFGPSTYYDGPTMSNFLTWFTGIYNTYNPKVLATRFYFSEGNTTGIILFSIYPLLINQFFKAKKKWFHLLLIVIQGIAMYVLATRVATYGVTIMIAAVSAVWFVLALLKKVKFDWKPFAILALLFSIFFASLPYTPAVVNIGIDNRNNNAVWEDESLRQQFKEEIGNEALIPGTAEFNYYYQHIFEQYHWLLTQSDVYYKWYYPYTIDPKFYVDLIFEVNFYDRTSGRQFQMIFFNYKFDKLNSFQKVFGFGYSRFMMGSILLEQDFVMQGYTLGYLGTMLLTGPWLVLLGAIILLGLKKFKYIWNADFLVLGIAIVSILGGAYLSGHVLDQFFSSTYLALYIGMMFSILKKIDH